VRVGQISFMSSTLMRTEADMTSILDILEKDPDFTDIKSELDPLIYEIFKLAKTNPKYVQFKKCLDDWNKRFATVFPIAGTVDSLQRLTVQPIFKEEEKENRRLKTVIGLFRYLGLVESLGTQIVDLSLLLLVANGHDFHVEREHEAPRIVHATSLSDLENSSLGVKIKFLERCNLKKSTKLIDKDLRNSIAHLNFKINDDGTLSARSREKKKKNIDIYQKISEFYGKYLMLFHIFGEIQQHVFAEKFEAERCKTIKEFKEKIKDYQKKTKS